MKKKQFKTKPNRRGGYTIIELLFAVANFAFIMMIAISAFVVVMRVYNRSNFSRQNQQATRTLVQQMEDDIKFSKVQDSGTADDICMVRSDSSITVRYWLDASSRTFNRSEGVGCSVPLAAVPWTRVFPYVAAKNGSTHVFTITEITHGSAIPVAIVDISFNTAKGAISPGDPSDPFHDEMTVNATVTARGGTF